VKKSGKKMKPDPGRKEHLKVIQSIAEAAAEYKLTPTENATDLLLAERAAGVETWDWDLVTNTYKYHGGCRILADFNIRVHQDWMHAIHPHDREHVRRELQAALENPGQPCGIDYRVIMDDGTERFISTRGKFYRDDAGKPVRMLGANIDISDQQYLVEALHDHIRQLAVVAELGKMALRSELIPRLMDRIVEEIAKTLKVEFCKILELLPDQNVLLLRAGVGWHEGLVGEAVVPSGMDSQAGYTLQSDGPVVVEDLRTEQRFSGPPILHEHHVISGISVIIQGSARPWGVLGVHTSQQRMFTQDDVNFLQSIANILAEALELKSSVDELRQSEEKFRGLMESAADGIVITNAEGLIDMVNAHLESMTGYNRVELIGQPVEILVPERYTGHKHDRMNFLKLPATRLMGNLRPPLAVRCKDGSEFLAEISLVSLQLANGTIISTTIRDISEQVRAEQSSREIQDRLRRLTSRMHAAREEERTRVARDIHDELGQSLTGLKMDLSWLSGRIPRTWTAVKERVQAMIMLVESTINFVRGLATSLRPAILDDLGLKAAIEWQIQGFAARTGCRYSLDLTRVDIGVENIRDTTIFRIFQEALTNIARHAKAELVEIALHQIDARLVLTVTDDGMGITQQKLTDNQSLGLIGMRERASAMDGEVQIETAKGKGTRIILSIPLGRV